MLNKDVFAVDPSGRRLPNDGVTALDTPSTQEEWEVLRYELEQFVAEGEYREGLRRILNSYLANVDKGIQPSCWVSGFYGSGKSHFVRVLTYLWTNPVVNGVAARSLVKVPEEISSLLKEIDSLAARDRTVTFAAAGVMRRASGSSVAQPLMEILLSAAGLPTAIGPARFVLWLKREEVWDAFVQALQEQGRTVDDVKSNLFVSPAVRQALLRVLPNWEPDAASVGRAIQANFQIRQATDDQVIETIKQVLETRARESKHRSKATLPLTLLVLDELQQYIGDDGQLLLETQDLIERLGRQFQGRMLVVAAGQSALTANDLLARFQDRFTVHVQLQSRDVETVVRQVVLRKDPVKVPELTSVLESVSGEISRHLAGSRLAHSPADKPDLVSDYPLLPTRRRFMAQALRATDRGGAGQVRTQLRVALDAVSGVAAEPVGTAVPASAIFEIKRDDLLNQGVISHELANRIDELADGTTTGVLRRRAVELVFLIEQLDNSLGLQANADTLADLLVSDLTEGSALLRAELPAVLQSLEGNLLVLDDDGQYRIQSKTDAEWERAYREKRAALMSSTGEQVQVREDAIRRRVEQEISTVKVVHGATNTSRRYTPVFGEMAPADDEAQLSVWVRSGWDVPETVVKQQSAERGMADATVMVYLPKMHDAEFKNAVADAKAAAHVVHTQPAPTTDDGERARDAMRSLATRAEARLEGYAQSVVGSAVVLLGGGEVVTGAGSFGGNLREALNRAAVRKFRRFNEADNAGWPQVFRRAREGNPDAISMVGHAGPPSTHPVLKEVRGVIEGGISLGAGIHKRLAAAPYGWSKDAVNGALAALVQAEELSARDGASVVPAVRLQENQMGRYDYRIETVVVTLAQRQRLKKLAAKLEKSYDPRVDVNACLHALRDAARRAGGEAPLPAAPATPRIDVLVGKFGAEQEVAVADEVDALLQELKQWRATAERSAARLEQWRTANALLKQASPLPAHAQHAQTLEAVLEQRSLLQDPDPVAPVVAALRAELRTAVLRADARAVEAREQALALVAAVPHWAALSPEDQAAFLSGAGLEPVEAADVTSDTQLERELERAGIAARKEAAPAFAGKGQAAVQALLRKVAPQARTVKAPPALITTEEEAQAYLEALGGSIRIHLAAGDAVNLT